MSYIQSLKKQATPHNIFVIGLALVALVVFAMYMSNNFRFEGFTGSATTVTFYSMEGCPHCVAFKPEWEKFSQSPPPGVTTQSIDSADPRTAKAGINGFPTITVQKGSDKPVTYTGDRTAAALTSFVKSA